MDYFKTLECPEKLGDYRVLRELGRGGMGVVYLAEDPVLGRQVALKVLHLEHGGSGPSESMWAEARTIAALQHPNIIHVNAFKQIDGRQVIEMEYARRGSLLGLLDKPLPWAQAVNIASQALAGLAACHEHGIIHRDIKPQNLLLAEGDRVLLADFGLAKILDDMGISVTATASGMLVGTPRYAPPEAWDGAKPDPRWDVYAVGALLYEMLAGVPAYDGDSLFKLARQIALGERRPLLDLAPNVPILLADYVEKLLDSDPAHRPRDAAQALADLQAVAASLADGGGRARRAVRKVWRPKAAFGALALVAVSLLLGALYFMFAHGTTQNAPPAPVAEAPSSAPDAFRVLGNKFIFAAEDRDHGRELWAVDTNTGKPVLLVDAQRGSGSTDFRTADAVVTDGLVFVIGETKDWKKLFRTDGTPEGTFVVHEAPAGDGGRFVLLGASATRAYFNVVNPFQEIGLWESDGTREGTRHVSGDPHIGEITTLAMTDDGGIFFAGNATLRLDYLHPGAAASIGIASNMSRPAAGLIALKNRVLFCSGDEQIGSELWIADSTPGSAHLLADIAQGPNSSMATLTGVRLGDALVFAASDLEHGEELWYTDGTTAGTHMVKDLVPGALGSNMLRFTRSGKYVYFTAHSPENGREPWVTDGTPEHTFLLRDVAPSLDSSEPYAFCPFRDGLLFSAKEPVHGEELWFSDGTREGTRLVKDINPGPADASPGSTVVIGDRAYLSAKEPAHGEEVWVSDGTDVGTKLYADINVSLPEVSAAEPEVYAALGKLFLVLEDSEHGAELWVRDQGGPARLVRDIYPGAKGSDPKEFLEWNNRLYFSADDGTHGRELWYSDGTFEQTAIALDAAANALNGDPEELTPFGAGDSARLGFVATTPKGERYVHLLSPDHGWHFVNTPNPDKPMENPRKLSVQSGTLHFIADIKGRGPVAWRIVGDNAEEIPVGAAL